MFLKISVKVFLLLLLATILIGIQAFPQTTPLNFTSIPIGDPDLNAPGRGVEQWHDQNIINVPVEGTNTQRLDVYYRFVWTKIEGPTLGSYTWNFFDSLVNNAIIKKQKFSFGIMPLYPGGTAQNGLVSFDGGLASYPLYLHNLMQAESVKDWRTGTVWTPNYNSNHYLNRLLALHQAIDAHIKTTSFNGVLYRNVISCIDVRGYGAWGEWHSGYTPKNVVSDYPAGTFPTIATLKKIVDAHSQGFPDFPLVAMIAAFDANWLQNTMNPPEIAHYVLTQRNNWGLIGWRRDQWGATDSYLADYLENNNRTFGGLVFKDSIMTRWRSAPITGEPPGWNPNSFSDLERQVKLYHAASFGNGNYGTSPTNTIKSRVRASSKACGYRLILESGSLTLNGNNLTVALNWKNIGQAPTYEKWNVEFELKNSNNQTIWSGQSQFKPKWFLPSTIATTVTDNFTSLPAGTFNLNIIIKDPNGYRDPLPLAITGKNADGSYPIMQQITIESSVPTPNVAVTNNCGFSVLTASGYTGTLLWSTGENTPSITVTAPGLYTVTQTVSGSTSAPGSGTAAPKAIPSAPTVTVANNCGNSLLTATGVTGSLLWSSGQTTSSITVTTPGTYTVIQTVNSCASAPGSGVADPKAIPVLSSNLSATATSGAVFTYTATSNTGGTTFAWSRAAVTGISNGAANGTGNISETLINTTASPINVTYVYTLTANGCTNTQNLVVTVSADGSIVSPTVTTQPASQTRCAGLTASFSSAASGNPAPTVQWQESTNGTSWHNIAGATAGTLTFTTATADNNNQYRAVWTNSGGTVNSNAATLTVNSIPSAPSVSVVDNCGNSVLTATGTPAATFLWSTGATTNTITVTTAGTYTVTQTVDGCSSPAGSGTAAPKPIPSIPGITVSNNCGNSVLTATGFTGSLSWSTGETTNSITVTTAGVYTVTQTVNGCTSAAGSGTAAPLNSAVEAPVVNVVNNCNNSVLTATGVTGSLLWSTGETTSSITVTTAGTYTVTQTVNGCTSAPASKDAAPLNSEVNPPAVDVVNNCGNSVLTATGENLLWSTGATTASITVASAGTYTVTQTVNGCTSPAGNAVAAPKAIPLAPVVTVANDCNQSILTASGSAGNFEWSNGQTTASITVITGGTYTVTQTNSANGCTSPAGSGTAAPKAIPLPPVVTVVNNCGNSVLSATGTNLLWSTGETTSSITVTTAGTYTVTQTVNGCTSAPASKDAAPLNSEVNPPAVDVVNNCGNSVLTATGENLLWSNGATTSSITVTTPGTYTVTQTVNGCSSPSATAQADPQIVPSPVVTVANNCGNSVLSAVGTNLVWSTGETTSSITVTTAGSYTVTQTVNGCTSVAGTGVAAPKPIPVLSSNLSASATSGNAFTYTATSATTGTTFAWSRAAVTGIGNTAASGTGNINETLINTTASPVSVTYVYTLTAGGCTNNQNVVVTVNPVTTINCVINGSIASNFTATSIPAGRFIWFSSVLDRGNISGVTGAITFNITNSRITFTANSQQYTLNVPNSKIRYDSTVTTATTEFVNNVWETVVPRTYNGYVFMGGLNYQVLTNLPGSITNVTWTATISIDKAGIRPTWKWGAAVYTSLGAYSALGVKPKNGKDQNLYANNDNAGTPENYKLSVVSGAKGNGGTNYTGTYSSTSSATCSTSVGQRSAEPVTTGQLIVKEIPALSVELLGDEKLEVIAVPNPSSTSFNLAIKGNRKSLVSVKVIDISGRVVERHEKVPANNLFKLGQRLAAGSYFIEVIQDDQKRILRVIKVN